MAGGGVWRWRVAAHVAVCGVVLSAVVVLVVGERPVCTSLPSFQSHPVRGYSQTELNLKEPMYDSGLKAGGCSRLRASFRLYV